MKKKLYISRFYLNGDSRPHSKIIIGVSRNFQRLAKQQKATFRHIHTYGNHSVSSAGIQIIYT